MGKQKKNRIDTSGSQTDRLGSLGNILAAAGFEVNDSTPTPSLNLELRPSPSPDQDELYRQKGLHLHVERKGRGGKTVTIVKGFHMSGEALSQTARSMSRALGCGATTESTESEGQIILQGDNADRARNWLLAANAQLKK